MLELFLLITLLIVMAYLGLTDSLMPKLDKLASKFGLQEEPHTNQNIGSLRDSLVGAKVIVENDFEKSKAGTTFEGRVKARGVGWRAEQISGDSPCSEGDQVVVRRIEGNKLFVEKLDCNLESQND